MKRYLIPIIMAILVLTSLSMAGCSQGASYSDDDVIASFNSIARAQALADRQDYLRYWSTQTILGEVKYVDKSIYEVRFPDIQFTGIEVWRIDMESSKILPYNGGALLSAVYLFCNDRNDKRGDCQLYSRLLDELKHSLPE